MADISKITLPNSDEYNIKDVTARTEVAGKQDVITADGILQGDGEGNITAAGTTSTGSLSNPSSDGTYVLQNVISSGTSTLSWGEGGGGSGSIATTTSVLKGDGSGGAVAATAGTDFAAASHTHGNITNDGDITATAPTIANGDQLIINDDSAGKITNGPTFDGSTTTQFLSKKGTWESLPADSDENVKQTAATPSSYTYWRPLVVGSSSNATEGFSPSTSTAGTYTFNTLEVQPSSGSIRLGQASFYNGSYTSKMSPETLSANRTITIPNKTGTLALTSDIPDVSSFISSESDPIFGASAAAGITSTDITNWDGKASGSHTHGDITSGGDITATAPTIANGDQLVINDDSASKITNGPTFDGSTTNKYLSPKGTWENIPDISGKIDTAGTGLSKSGTTLNHSNAVTAQTTQGLYPIKIDAQGHISAYGDAVTIPDVSGKIDTAGTGLSKSGTTLNHSNSVTAQSTSGVYPIIIDAQGHITEYGSAISYITPPSTVSAGDVLTYDTTNGWIAAAPASGLPAQSSSTNGKVLQSTYDSQTSTASASWESLESVSTLTVDSAPVASSTNLVTSGGVYSAISNIEALPSQTGNSGKFLTTNGSAASWATVDALPSQTSNSGKFLTTNGTTASWATVDALPSQSGNSGKYLTTNGSVASWGDTSTATALGVETAPSSGSSNLVTSGGVYTAINNKVNRTTAVNVADTNYSTVMARGISIGTTDLVDGTSSLASGTIYIYYEQ